MTMVVVTHEMGFAREVADRVIFMDESGEVGKAYMESVMKISSASALGPKVQELCYLSVLAAVGLRSGMDFHVRHAKALGATRDEVKSAILAGLPAVGLVITGSLAPALKAFDEAGEPL